MIKQLRRLAGRWADKDAIIDKINELVDTTNQRSQISVKGAGRVTQGPFGTAITINRQDTTKEGNIYKITVVNANGTYTAIRQTVTDIGVFEDDGTSTYTLAIPQELLGQDPELDWDEDEPPAEPDTTTYVKQELLKVDDIVRAYLAGQSTYGQEAEEEGDELPEVNFYHVYALPQYGFWAEITGNTSLGNNQWTYSWSRDCKTTAGYGGWDSVTPEVSGADNAYNTIEDINTGGAAHIEGNGVDPANIDTDDFTFAMMPCTTGNIVWLRPIFETDTNTAEYWFSYENGVDGSCD